MLHELVARHAQTMLAELRDAGDPGGAGRLPRYVERELAAYHEEWLVRTFGTPEGDSLVLTIPGKLVFVMMLPALAGYVLLMMGIYAAVFGERGQEQSFGWSLFRILFGLGATLGVMVVAILLYGWLRRL